MHAVQVFSAGIKFEPNFVKMGQVVQAFKHRKIYQIQHLTFFYSEGKWDKNRQNARLPCVFQTSAPSAMTPHSTAAPVPGYTPYRRNVRHVYQLQQAARIRGLVHGLALQRTHVFLHLGTTVKHSGETKYVL